MPGAMDKDLVQLISYMVAIVVIVLIWRATKGDKTMRPRPGVFSNRLKDAKREHAEDQEAKPL
jgi:hypothetical protein